MCNAAICYAENTDVDAAFPNATLQEDVYIKPRSGYPALPPGMVMKLNRALYGLKQSPREWNITLDNNLCRDLKMNRLKTEQCIYVRFTEDRSKYLILGVYVDDLIVTGSTEATADNFKSHHGKQS